MIRKIILILSFCFASCLQVNAQNNLEKAQFVVGYIDHPSVTSPYMEIIETAYQDIGIDVEFIKVGAERGMMLVDSGIIDADVIRFSNFSERFPNVAFIPDVFATGETILICQINALCSREAFNDRKNIIATNLALHDSIDKTDPLTIIAATIIDLESVKKVLKMLELKRVTHAILPADVAFKIHLENNGYKFLVLSKSKAYHAINKKHAKIIEPLSKAIQARMKALGQLQ